VVAVVTLLVVFFLVLDATKRIKQLEEHWRAWDKLDSLEEYVIAKERQK